jgi:heme A synthase
MRSLRSEPTTSCGPSGVRAPSALRLYAVVVAAATFFLVLSGGQVTSTDSGDAVPTWPLPLKLELKDGVFFELGHRHVAGAVGLLAVVLWGAMASCAARLRPGLLKCAGIAVALVALQALLGGLRVLSATAHETNEDARVVAFGIAHAMLGQIFFAWMAGLAVALNLRGSPLERQDSPAPAAGGRNRFAPAASWALAALVLQLFLGALLRLTRPGPVGLLVFFHVIGAVLAAFAALELVFAAIRDPRAPSWSAALAKGGLALIAAQALLGFGAFLAVKGLAGPAAPEFGWRTVVPTLHQGLGALILAVFAIIAWSARRSAAAAAPDLERSLGAAAEVREGSAS